MSTTYHVTWRSIGLVFKLAILLVVPIEITCAMIFSVFFAPLLVDPFSGINYLVLAAFGTVGIIVFSLVVLILVYRTGTFLRLSPEGLEYHRWPFTTITCRWDEAEKLAQGNVMGMTVATLMIPKEKMGWKMPVGGGVLGSAKYKLVPLNDFQGWPEGELMNELRQFAPKLFS
jgi:hypothetical protein